MSNEKKMTHPLKPKGFGNRLFYRFSILVTGSFLRLFYRFKVEGSLPPDKGSYIVAANHESLIDPVALQVAVTNRRLHYMMTSVFYFTAALNHFSRAMRCIPVIDGSSTNRDALRLALDVLKAEEVVGIFPEGQRVNGEEQANPFRGVAFIARRAGVPVIPARIRGTGQALPKGAKWFRRSRVTVTIGDPVQFVSSNGKKASLEDMTESIMSSIWEL